MSNQDFDVRKYVKQMSGLLDLKIKDEYEDGVVKNFERIRAIAHLVNSFPIAEQMESAKDACELADLTGTLVVWESDLNCEKSQ